MNNKIAIAAVASLVLLVGVVILLASNNNQPTNTTEVETPRQTTEPRKTEVSEQENEVTYRGYAVSPETLTVKKGTTVTWTNEDDAQHDVTPETETADFQASELFGKNEVYKVTFNTVGSYPYHCSPHPYMKGTIEVVE